MKKMFRLLVFLGALFVLNPALSFAEENVWQGPYVGVNGGLLLATYTATEYYGPWDYGEYSLSDTAYSLGVQAGYNWSVGTSGIVGVEADINYSNFDDSRTFGDGDYINGGAWDWFGTLRARGGLTVDKALVYVTGGLAFVEVDYQFGDLTDSDYFVSDSSTETGLAAGAGVEFLTSDNVSIKGEYLYIGLPSTEKAEFGLDYDPGDFVSSAHTFRIGLNYMF